MANFRQLFSFNKKEIEAVFAFAFKKDSINGLKLLTSPIKDANDQTFGKLLIIIPKAAGKAHERNLIRRRAKAIFFEEKLYQKPVKSVLLVYKEAKKLSFQELKQFLVKNLK